MFGCRGTWVYLFQKCDGIYVCMLFIRQYNLSSYKKYIVMGIYKFKEEYKYSRLTEYKITKLKK